MKLLRKKLGRAVVSLTLSVLISFGAPGAVLAQEAVDANGGSTGPVVETETGVGEENTGPPADVNSGAPENTGASECTGAGCGQGSGQGSGQGTDQGGPSLEDLGGYVDEEGNDVLPEGVIDTRQGASQGMDQGAVQGAAQGSGQGSSVDLSGENTNTGADSENGVDVDVSSSDATRVNNTANDNTEADLAANSGGNTGANNTGTSSVDTGDANIGVTQVKQDNTTALNGEVGLSTNAHTGDISGDLELDFTNAIALLTGGGDARSIRAINDTTGQNSENDIILSTIFEELNEVQNDGRIDNTLALDAITGQNTANANTGGGVINTGDANVAATLVNLLNTTVLNGKILITVEDVFGNLYGDIHLPNLSQLASFLVGSQTEIDVTNANTGADSTNDVDIDIEETEITKIDNEADIKTKVSAEAITGQNDALANTGGGEVDTGDASVTASNVSIANTTVEGGSWGLVIVNSLNRWLGYLVGDSGEVRQLSQDETIREIEARNSNTGADSDNTIDIDDKMTKITDIDNRAKITNDISARAITGQNEASANTGQGVVETGDANILVTAVNIANTTVKDAVLGIAVVNIFGDWFGDLFYDNSSLTAVNTAPAAIDIEVDNSGTGADSENTVDINIDRTQETDIDNEADIETILDVTIDTGNNRANKNTSGGSVETGSGSVGLHSRSIANIVGLALDGGLALEVQSQNSVTGANSKNKIMAKVNDERIVTVNNAANVSTLMPGSVNTGNNQANDNTIGGDIDTGSIDASVEVHDLLNRVLFALGTDVSSVANGTGTFEIDAAALNELTGFESENSTAINAARNLLKSIANSAIVETLFDMLFNTGGNDASRNTASYSAASAGFADDESDVILASNDDEDETSNEQQATSNAVGGDDYVDEASSEDDGDEEAVVAATDNDSGSGWRAASVTPLVTTVGLAENNDPRVAGAATIDEPVLLVMADANEEEVGAGYNLDLLAGAGNASLNTWAWGRLGVIAMLAIAAVGGIGVFARRRLIPADLLTP